MFSKSILIKKNELNIENIDNINFEFYIKKKRINENNYENNDENLNIINKTLTNKINKYKNDLFNNNLWNDFRKISNNYELVNIVLNSKNLGISSLRPLSRSYYKMIEIITDYKVINNLNTKFNGIKNIVLLAEAPGGFLEAINDILGNNVNYYAISLIKNDNNIPSWHYAIKKYIKQNNINFLYGHDKTGDLYKLINIFNYINNIGYYSCELITSDGGIDFSENYINQEMLFYRLFLCEITLALSLQKKNGTFICKFFEFNTIFTIKLIYILYIFYDNVIITKPNISRKANSEKYLICKNLKQEVPQYILKNFYKIIINWDYDIIDIFKFKIPNYFLDSIKIYNEILLQKQLKHFEYIDDLYNNLTKKRLYKIIKEQIKTSYNWCKQYNIIIDINNIFLNCDLAYIINNYYAYLLLFKYHKLKNV